MDTTAPPPIEVELSTLADVVWSERAALEQLAFKLVALNLVLGADLRRYVGRCLDEVDAAWGVLDRVDAHRTVTLAALTTAWGRPSGSIDLTDLATVAPEPWATVFADHRDHLEALAAEVGRLSVENADLCARTLERLDEDLAVVGAATRRALDEPGSGLPVAPPLRLVKAEPRPTSRPATSGSFA